MAATRIQRIQRGKKDRKRVQELKAQRAAAAAEYDNLALSEADIAAREAAAVRIQVRSNWASRGLYVVIFSHVQV